VILKIVWLSNIIDAFGLNGRPRAMLEYQFTYIFITITLT